MVTDMQIPVLMSSDKLTQPIIAPVQDTLVAKQNYAVGNQFIYNNTLYKVTSAISQNNPITIGTNAVRADDITTQMTPKTDYTITPNTTYIDNSSITCIKYGHLVVVTGAFKPKAVDTSGAVTLFSGLPKAKMADFATAVGATYITNNVVNIVYPYKIAINNNGTTIVKDESISASQITADKWLNFKLIYLTDE